MTYKSLVGRKNHFIYLCHINLKLSLQWPRNSKSDGPFHVNSQEVVRAPSPIFLKFYSNCHYPIWWTSAKF